MSGENPRVCNQGILNYLLIELRRDKDFAKFREVLKLMIYQPELKKTTEIVLKGICMHGKLSAICNEVLKSQVHNLLIESFYIIII